MEPLEARDIQKIIPHRYPMLLIDPVIELEAAKRAVAIKNVTRNEWFFEGHFPQHPIMPGVLIVEALAQTGAVAALSAEQFHGKLGLFRWHRRRALPPPGHPGDQLRLEVTLDRIRGPVGKATATATVDGEVAASGTLTFAMVDPPAD